MTTFGNYILDMGEEFRINSYTTNKQDDSHVAALANGGFVVTWTSNGQDGSVGGIYGQRYDAAGNKTGGEFQVNTFTDFLQTYSSVTALSNGGFVVTWSSYNQGSNNMDVYAQRYDAAGLKAGGEFLVNTTTADTEYTSHVAALDNGGFVISWTALAQDGSGFGIFGQRYDAAGNKAGGEFLINTTTAGSQQENNVTALHDGGFVVTWKSSGQDGSGDGVYGQRYDATGNKAGGEFLINTTTAGDQNGCHVTALNGGGFVATWASYGQDGSFWGVFAQRFDAAGNKAGGEFQVNTYTGNYQIPTGITALANGGFMISWESDGQDSSYYGVYGQCYHADGTKDGGEFRINSYTTGGQYDSSMATLPDGRIVVTWTSDGQDGDSFGVYSRILTTATPLAGATALNDGNLVGHDYSDYIDGGLGADKMIGGKGNDYYVVDNAGDKVIETLSAAKGGGIDTIFSSVSFSLANLAYVENVELIGTGDLNLTGNKLDNILIGNGQSNIIDGGAGADRMEGGAGNDTYILDNVGDVVVEDASNGSDTVILKSGALAAGTMIVDLHDARWANIENVTLKDNLVHDIMGTDANNELTGNALNNVLYGGNGDDFLDGGKGADILMGGAGYDTYVIDNKGDQVIEANSDGTDSGGSDYAISSISLDLNVFAMGRIEGAELTGKANLSLTGNDADNWLNGNAGNNRISGGGGDDTMRGYQGNDTLLGDDGNDLIFGGDGNDRIFGGDGGNGLYGESGNDLLVSGNDGSWMDGGVGNDVLISGMGEDTLKGGAGNDTFRFTAVNSRGLDTVKDFDKTADKVNIADLLDNSTDYHNGTNGHHLGDYVRIVNGDLQIDADGAGTHDGWVTLANFQNGTTLTLNDLHLVVN